MQELPLFCGVEDISIKPCNELVRHVLIVYMKKTPQNLAFAGTKPDSITENPLPS